MTTVEASAPAPGRLWHDIREAIRGSHHQDYTDGPIGRALRSVDIMTS